jgi:LysR family transcriptional regulator, transcriptional activator of nhaA
MDRLHLDPDQLNYHHLRYFWVVAREGSISRACTRLHVSQPTISGQLRALEQTLGGPLFVRRGRNLHLTALGEVVARHADGIFALGRELAATIAGGEAATGQRLNVGISDQVPKLVAYRLLEPALAITGGVRLTCIEDTPTRLFAELAIHGLDVVLSDEPLPAGLDVRAYSHLLGETGVAFFAAKSLKPAVLRREFPASLNSVPLLLPHESAASRLPIARWLAEQGVNPRIAGEFQDSALLKAFGQAGVGIFAAPAAIADSIIEQYAVEEIGRTDLVRERFYAVTNERRISNPAVAALTKAGRRVFERR